MIERLILPLDQVELTDAPVAGSKAATLGTLLRAGLPVPSGFVLPTTAYQEFVRANALAPAITRVCALARESAEASDLASELDRLSHGFQRGVLPIGLAEALAEAYARLITKTGALVVRSSAIEEDLSEASFAGQQLTVLNVRRFEDLLRAIRRCWASLFSVTALRYRRRLSRLADPPLMAVLVQAQITCQAAGVLFSRDPVGGSGRVVIEAVWGMGAALAQGEVSPDRYLVDRDRLTLAAPPRIGNKRCQRLPDSRIGTRLAPVPVWRRRRPILNPTQLGGLALLGLQIEHLLRAPQDVEWGLAGGRWFVFQARPITTPVSPGGEQGMGEQTEWTNGFLDERLSEPVSPLGWSILRQSLEEIAFREPLRMLGVEPAALEPITRLWNGRPYVNVAVFEALYKLFPDALLPEDARRFFPGGDVSRRTRAPRPRSLLDPRVLVGLVGAMVRDRAAISPFQNDHAWREFEHVYTREIAEIGRAVDALEHQPSSGAERILALIDAVERQNRQLLRIHRWSLTYAEVWYSLLRRLARIVLGPERAPAYCAGSVAHLDDYSVGLNRALHELAKLSRDQRSDAFSEAFRRFLVDYGHRSLSLDLLRPSFAADPDQVLALLQTVGRGDTVMGIPKHSEAPVRADGAWLLAPLGWLARRYARLRENQRFTWQRGLALLRRLYVQLGTQLTERGVLRQPDDVFFLTADEVRDAALSEKPTVQALVAERRRRYDENRSVTSYPRFLVGDRPRAEQSSPGPAEAGETLRGEAVSPGVGRGRARVIRRPDDLTQVEAGDVLVTRGLDPGWTPVFERLAGLVMESGGQLSHASVVAREYGLPAVVGIDRATSLIRTGDAIIVDGSTGVVKRLQVFAEGSEVGAGGPRQVDARPPRPEPR